jgi:parvulin-like peptidyl-prolyl isomerase
MVAAGALAALETTRLANSQASLPDGVVARVGEFTITAEELDRATEALARDRREGQQPGDRAHVLDRLVDEALLVQLALDQGLAHRDSRTRADLTGAALQLLVSEAEMSEPSVAELEAFYAERRSELRGAPRVQLEQRFARGDDALTRVLAEPPGALEAPPLPLPSGWLSDRDLREIFGGSFAAQALAAPEGTWLPPHERDGGVHRVRVLRREAPGAPPFDQVRDEVLALYRRERADDAVRAYLERARNEVTITQRSLHDSTSP